MEKDLEIKHFRSVSRGDREKSLVTELVEDGSETHQFLQKMEEARKKRECLLTVDMRGKVAGLCQRYQHKDRVFFLDDVSKNILERGMEQNNGVFTVGTYEDIVFGEHTVQAQKQRAGGQAKAAKKQTNAGMLGKSRIDSARAASAPMARQMPGPQGQSAAEVDEDADLMPPEQVTFGYYKRRSEDRLEMVIDVVMEFNGVRYPAKTRDVSKNGARIYLTYVPGLAAGHKVFVTFTELQMPGASALDRIAYTVMRCEEGDNHVTLCMRREVEDHADLAGASLVRHLDRARAKCRVNLDDDVNSVMSLIYERVYAQSCLALPLFIGRQPTGDYLALAYGANAASEQLLRCFDRRNHAPDLTPLVLPARVAGFVRAAAAGQAVYMVAYRTTPSDQGGELHSVCHFECANTADFKELIRFAQSQKEYYIWQVVLTDITPPAEMKLNLFLSALQLENEQAVHQLLAGLGDMVMVASVHDVTKTVAGAMLGMDLASAAFQSGKGLLALNAGSVMTKQLKVLVGNEWRNLADGTVVQRVPVAGWARPRHVEMGYLRGRAEDRYVLESEVEVEIGGRSYRGRTSDISSKGVGLVFNEPVVAKAGAAALVTFTELQRLVNHVRLKKVPYIIKGISPDQKSLGLQGSSDASVREVGAFFADMIARNRDKLDKDLGDLLNEAVARLHESIFTANLTAMPLFLYRGESGVMLGRIGGNDDTLPVAQSFDLGEGYPDYRPLVRKGIAARMQGLTRISAGQRLEMTLYQYQETLASGRQRLVMIDDAELQRRADKVTFLQQLLAQPQVRVLRVALVPIAALRDYEMDMLMEPIAQQSRHKAQKLHEELQLLTGLGEVTDITGLFRVG